MSTLVTLPTSSSQADSSTRGNHATERPAVLLIGHGSRDPQANQEFEGLIAVYRDSHPQFEVLHGYVELAEPSLADALRTAASRSTEVIVVPLFLFCAGHVKNDIPLALASARSEYPGVRFLAARELGVHPKLVDLSFERVRACLTEFHDFSKTAVLVVGRGASDPDANGDFYKLVRLLSEGRGFSWVLPCFIGIAQPLFADAAELLSRSRPERIVVVPYFLFGGRLMTRLREQVEAFGKMHSWIPMHLADHLGAESIVLDVIDERIQQARIGEKSLPCDTCQYRHPISGIASNVGGLKALLWSIRHTFTHTQAAPHAHAHRPLTKHVLVCGNADCADRGSIGLLSAMRRLVAASGHEQDVRVTRTSCMGRCGEGPTVAVYPDGIWYRNVLPEDAEELVREHLLNDRLVGRLVDNIMQ
ncbi:MAG TPA: CbiX/SirB N-terminal domain-containing protein [Candidatus Angelobacter sp.]|nr:CbiX/SirB N-terminal domain-containing protein [Candidatus Angelobacter sp.]